MKVTQERSLVEPHLCSLLIYIYYCQVPLSSFDMPGQIWINLTLHTVLQPVNEYDMLKITLDFPKFIKIS